MRQATYRGKTTLYISHGGNLRDPDWFLVEAPAGELGRQIERFHESGRTVYEIKAKPWHPRWRWYLSRANRRRARARRRVRRVVRGVV